MDRVVNRKYKYTSSVQPPENKVRDDIPILLFIVIESQHTTYNRYLQPLERVVHNLGRFPNITYSEHPFIVPILQNGFQVMDLFPVESFSHVLHLPDIPEEDSPKGSITGNHLLYCIQTSESQQDKLLIGRHIAGNHLLQPAIQNVQFRLDNGLVNILFAPEVGVQGPPTATRCLGDIVHGGIIDPFSGEKLPSHVYQVPFCFRYSHFYPVDLLAYHISVAGSFYASHPVVPISSTNKHVYAPTKIR